MLLCEFDWKPTVIESRGPVLVEFCAPWSPPCAAMDAVIEALAPDYLVCKVDIDAHPELARQHDIQAIPTLLIFHGGEIVMRHLGFISQATLRAELNRYRAATLPPVLEASLMAAPCTAH